MDKKLDNIGVIENDKIKVNFTMSIRTKEFLDEINSATIPYKPNSRSEIIEKY